MSTFGNGTLVSGAVSGTASRNTNGTTTLYTVPASRYAIVSVGIDSLTNAQTGVTVNNVSVASTLNQRVYNLYLGPGDVLALVQSQTGAVSCDYFGVEFRNSN